MVDRVTLELNGPSGPLTNTFLRQGGTRVAIVLPGLVGGWTTPATYYPVLALLDQDFDALCLDSVYTRPPDLDRLKGDAEAAVYAATRAGDYVEALVMGKSLGTAAMAELLHDGTLPPQQRSIWLTPLLRNERVASAVKLLRTPGLFVIGTHDAHFERGTFKALGAAGHELLILDGANHGLVVDGDATASADIPARLVSAVRAYAGRPVASG